jgi:ribosome-associated translation inhibitor RaiA
MSDTETAAEERTPASVDQIRLGTGFAESERDRLVEVFRKLDRRLKRWAAEEVDMELAIKERDSSSQYVTLECWIHDRGDTRFVATSREKDLQDALMDCREDLWRQIDDHVTKVTDSRRK